MRVLVPYQTRETLFVFIISAPLNYFPRTTLLLQALEDLGTQMSALQATVREGEYETARLGFQQPGKAVVQKLRPRP